MAPQRPTRVYLAVPAHRSRLVAKAAASAADAVFMDLEDAVPPSEKGAALEEAARALCAAQRQGQDLVHRREPLPVHGECRRVPQERERGAVVPRGHRRGRQVLHVRRGDHGQ